MVCHGRSFRGAILTIIRVATVPNDGLIRYLGVFNMERLLIVSPKALAEVLVTKSYDFMKPSTMRNGIGRILGFGILFAEGDVHKAQRKDLMPAFAFRHIKELYPIFWEKSRESALVMTEWIKSQASMPESSDIEKSPIVADQCVMEVGEWASRATLDIIGVAGMGKDFGAIANPDTPLFKTYNTIFRPSRQAQTLNLIGLLLPSFIVRNLPIKMNNEVEEAAKLIRQTCHDLIRMKKEKLEKKELTDVDILSVALESGGFSDDNLVDQLMTFLAAGHETTASALTWAIYLMCLHPAVQTRLRAEINASLPSISSDKPVTSLDIDRMPYLKAVCNEVLRYYPPVPLTVRDAAVDTSILGHHVPAGTKIFLVPWATNKDKSLWGEDADKFNPERWLAGDSSSPHVANGGAASNYALLTFLHGPRGCIGQAFSKAEFACLLAAWVGRFEFDIENEEERDEKNMVIKGGITARPAKGLRVKVRMVGSW
jgi:cytochrome P450